MTRSTIAGLLVLAAAAGCSSGSKSRPGDVRAACERYVKDRLRQPSAVFSNESVDTRSVKMRAALHGTVDSAIRSPAPGAPTRIRWSFMCAVERHGKRWDLVALTGLDE